MNIVVQNYQYIEKYFENMFNLIPSSRNPEPLQKLPRTPAIASVLA